MKGIIHSFQSMGAVDGPGLRYVIFMQGCPLRCVYCHNPDTWSMEGEEYKVEDVLERILRYRPYIEKTGGVTVSGGEPLLQWKFIVELFRRLRGLGIHTALDTSGIGELSRAEELLGYTDLVLCDLKFANQQDYLEQTGGELAQVLAFLKLTEEKKIPLWIRHVVVPGLTDSHESISRIVQLAKQFSNLKKLELLPFKKLCAPKYETLGLEFPLKDWPECSEAVIKQLEYAIDREMIGCGRDLLQTES
jgi:pyruvate formate lyase activating enzyme